jgi:hypothetical protein
VDGKLVLGFPVLALVGVTVLIAKERMLNAAAALWWNVIAVVGTALVGGFLLTVLALPLVQLLHALK